MCVCVLFVACVHADSVTFARCIDDSLLDSRVHRKSRCAAESVGLYFYCELIASFAAPDHYLCTAVTSLVIDLLLVTPGNMISI